MLNIFLNVISVSLILNSVSVNMNALCNKSNATRKLALSRLKERCYCLTLANTKRKTEQARTRWARFRDLLGIEEENN